MLSALKWPVVVLLIAAGAAWMYRFEPLSPGEAKGSVAVWDRWKHELCLFAFGVPHGLHCSVDSLSERPKWQQAPVLPDARQPGTTQPRD